MFTALVGLSVENIIPVAGGAKASEQRPPRDLEPAGNFLSAQLVLAMSPACPHPRHAGDISPDSLPWLFGRGHADTLPWAARHLD